LHLIANANPASDHTYTHNNWCQKWVTENWIRYSYHHTVEVEQIMAHLVAEMRTSQPMMDANIMEMKGKIMARLDSKIEANDWKIKAI
jgi:hypothetical protein